MKTKDDLTVGNIPSSARDTVSNREFSRPAKQITMGRFEDCPEVMDLRNARSKTFCVGETENGNYIFRTLSSLGAVHYRNENGNWEEIDLGIDEVPRKYSLTQENGSSNNTYGLDVMKSKIGYDVVGKKGGEVRITLDKIGNTPVNSQFIDQHVNTKIENANELVWSIPEMRVTIRLVTLPGQVKLFKELHSISSPRRFEWTVVEAKEESNLEFNKDGAVGVDDEGNTIEVLEERNIIQEDDKYTYSKYIEEYTGRSKQIVDSKTREREWKQADQYPVEIDPSTSQRIPFNTHDAYYRYYYYYKSTNTNGTVGGGNVLTTNTTTFFTNSGGSTFPFPVGRVAAGYTKDVTYQTTTKNNTKYYTQYVRKVYRWPGLEFSPSVPQGVNVTSANLFAYQGGGGYAYQTFFAWDTGNAATWSTNTPPVAITKTNASVYWPWPGLFTKPVTSLVQEVLNNTGWSSGNNMAFAGFPVTGFNQNQITNSGYALDYTTAPGTQYIAELSIGWTEGGGLPGFREGIAIVDGADFQF